MERATWVTAGAALCVVLIASAGPANPQQLSPEAVRPAVCDQLHVDGRASVPLRTVTLPPPNGCATRTSNGFPVPDPNCTPGAVDPTVTIVVLRDPNHKVRARRRHGGRGKGDDLRMVRSAASIKQFRAKSDCG
jgi:hypothetical protein